MKTMSFANVGFTGILFFVGPVGPRTRTPKMNNPTISLLLSSLLVLSACGAGGQVLPNVPEDSPLSYAVFTSEAQGFHATSTVLFGETEAVLIDAQFNLESGRALAAWLKDTIPGHSLKAIYISHAHPDHFFGVEEVLAVYPGTPVVATAEVVAHAEELAPKKLAQWKPMYKEDLTSAPILPTLVGGALTVDGTALAILPVSADTEPMTAVHVPSIGLVVASDLAYGGVHAWLADAPTAGQRQAWLDSLATVAKLDPKAVVAGHKAPTHGDEPHVLAATASYIEAFHALASESASAASIQEGMMAQYPDLALPIILELAAKAAQ